VRPSAFQEDTLVIEQGHLYLPLYLDTETEETISQTTSPIESLETLKKRETDDTPDTLLQFDGKPHIQTLSLDTLVENYPQLRPDSYEQVKERALDEIQEEFRDEYMPLDNKLETIIFDVMPYFIDTKQGLDTTTTTKDDVIERIQEEVHTDISDYYDDVDDLFNIHELESKIQQVEQDATGQIDYTAPPEGDITHEELTGWVEEALKEMVYREETDKLHESLESRKDFADRNKDQLATLLMIEDRASLEIDDFGFEKDDDSYWVYVDTGDYALRGFDGNVYEFPNAEVGVRTDDISSPRILNRYRHPFLPTEDTYQGICLGNASAAPNNFNAENLIESIETGLNIILHGYFNESEFSGYHSLDGDEHHGGNRDIDFERYRTTESELERRDITVTNDFLDTDWKRRFR